MRKMLKFVLISCLILFVGLPAAFILFVMGMMALGVVIGVGSAILGLMLAAIKIGLMILVPVGIVWWVATRLMAPERIY
jgi:hypothetical protein